MLGGMRPKLSFANVISLIALFVALGGGAYAAVVSKNTVSSKSIKTGAVKSIDVKNDNLKGIDINEATLVGIDDCPSNASGRVGDVCYSGPQTTDWDAALRECASRGLRAPTTGEALLVINKTGGSTWTTDVLDGGNRVLIKVDEPKIVAVGENTAQPYVCVAHPTG